MAQDLPTYKKFLDSIEKLKAEGFVGNNPIDITLASGEEKEFQITGTDISFLYADYPTDLEVTLNGNSKHIIQLNPLWDLQRSIYYKFTLKNNNVSANRIIAVCFTNPFIFPYTQ